MNRIHKSIVLALMMTCLSQNLMANSSIKVFLNGEEMPLAQEVKSANNVVMLPLKEISNNFGYDVIWDSQTGVIEIHDGSYVVKLKVGSKEADVNGKRIELPVTPKSFNGTTYVPLRFIGEAMDMRVKWDGKKKEVSIEAKYSFDKGEKKLFYTNKDGKKEVVAEGITILDGIEADSSWVNVTRTKDGSELVSVGCTYQGALTSSAYQTFYIKDGKIIDQVVNEGAIFPCEVTKVIKDRMVISDGKSIRIYNDMTGTLEKKYELKNWSIDDEFTLENYSDNYLLGRIGNTYHIIDLVNNKVTRVIDLLPNNTEAEKEDLGYVYGGPGIGWFDNIKLVWETDEALVFKYHSVSEDKDKTVTYMIGK